MLGDDADEKRIGAVVGPAVQEIEKACIGVKRLSPAFRFCDMFRQ